MPVSRLWRRTASRTLLQKSKIFTGINLWSGCTSRHGVLHGSTPSMPLLKEGFFAGKKSGFKCMDFVWARACSADYRRCFCTTEARIVDGNVDSFDLHPDDDISDWDKELELMKAHMRKYAASQREGPSVRKAALASEVGLDDSVLGYDSAVVDGIDGALLVHQDNKGGLVARNMITRRTGMRKDGEGEDVAVPFTVEPDAQDPSWFRCEDGREECLSSDRPEVFNEEENRLTVQSKYHNVFTPVDRQIVKAICELFITEGWSTFTVETLEKEFFPSLSHAAISAIILRQKNEALASSFFEWACEHKGHSSRIYHAYLLRLGETKAFDEMWALLSKMQENSVKVSGTTFCMIIRACGMAGVPTMAVEAHERAREYGFKSSSSLNRALLIMFFESNLLEEAKIFYSIMVQQGLAFDTHMVNALIKGFNQVTAAQDAKSAFEMMLKEGRKPNILSYTGLIEAYCSMRAIEKAIAAFSDLQRRGLKPTAPMLNMLLGVLCKTGRICDAIHLISSMNTLCTPNRSTFNILLHGLLLCKETSKAISLFSVMEQEGITNRQTFLCLASGVRATKQTKSLQQLLEALFAKHGYDMMCVPMALLDNLCRAGELDKAESLFDGMLAALKEPYVPGFAVMIGLYIRLKMPDKALKLLSELKGKGVRPTEFCYPPLIMALLEASRVADASKCFHEMLEYKPEPNAFMCDCLLQELCRHGMVDDALHVLDTIMRHKFSIRKRTLTELLKCFCKLGRVEEASLCFRALHKRNCLSLPKAAAQQALSVMHVMSRSSNEKERVSM